MPEYKLIRNPYLIFIVIAVSILLLGGYFYFNKTNELDSNRKIKIGIPLQPGSGTVIVAWKKGFFQRAGLNVDVEAYPTGKMCLLYGLIPGKVDFAVTGDVPFVLLGFKRNDIRILCAVGESTSVKEIIARKDHGILKPGDLIGKSIATEKASKVHYFLSAFLQHNMISEEDVNVLFIKPKILFKELTEWKIDAFCISEPYVSIVKKKFDVNAIIFKDYHEYKFYDFLTYSAVDTKLDMNTLNKMYKALQTAEDFIEENQEESMEIIAKTLKTNKKNISRIWEKYKYKVLDKDAIIYNLENKARWGIMQHLVDENDKPDYSELMNSKINSNI